MLPSIDQCDILAAVLGGPIKVLPYAVQLYFQMSLKIRLHREFINYQQLRTPSLKKIKMQTQLLQLIF